MILAAIILWLSLLVDRITGDPHSRYHPVAMLGAFIGWWGRPDRFPASVQKIAGVAGWFLTVTIFALPFFLFDRFAAWYLVLLIGPILLKTCFAWRSLEEHTRAVIDTAGENPERAKERVALMVSRDTGGLSGEQVLSAAYESMAENLVDSIISPLFYFSIFGLAGAAVFRAANTMDAMLGYRDDRRRIGWWSARADDALNYLPARITGLILLGYFMAIGRFHQAYSAMRRDARKRPGINGGIPMAIIAGGVGVKFEKPGVYTIGGGERTLHEGGRDVVRAVQATTLLFAFLAGITLVLLQLAFNI
jgi:adenosylcobinamide-phosphate synthase